MAESTFIEYVDPVYEEDPIIMTECNGCGHVERNKSKEHACTLCMGSMIPFESGEFYIRKTKGYTVIRCTCKRKLECHNFTNTCDCGRDYNYSGQLLALRSEWGNETGEHWLDCI